MEQRKLTEKPNFQEYVDRLKHELSVIRELKFERYFLTYAKIMSLVSQTQLIGAARGSAGGSLLSYVIGITQVDPIRFGLIFERFLTRKKKGFPDIDSDFSDRDAAVKTLISYFGDEDVIPVSNFAQLQVASLCKDLARLYDVPFDIVNTYTAKMRNEALAKAKQEAGFDAATWEFTFEVAERDSPSFRQFIEDMSKDHPQFRDALLVLFKQMRTISPHAGGVIIAKDTKNNMPIIKAKGGLQTPWSEGLNFRHLENFGFLKFDILGLGTLRMFEETIRRIIKRERRYVTFNDIRQWFYENLHPDNNAMDDMNVYKTVYWDKKYAGIFQFIKENTQNFMAEMKPKSIEDIAIATSIFRPGPLGLDRKSVV
jgi:DNA polymerase-3 subunit alpha